MEQIKPNELRIGNYYEIDGAIYQVTTINSDGCTGSLIRKPTGVHTNGRRRVGIPLTEEVLTACGFAKSALGYALLTHKHKRVSLRWIKRASLTDDRELDKPFARYNEVADIYYLHQLQNLYFALTGSELEVSLTGIGNSPIRD